MGKVHSSENKHVRKEVWRQGIERRHVGPPLTFLFSSVVIKKCMVHRVGLKKEEIMEKKTVTAVGEEEVR